MEAATDDTLFSDSALAEPGSELLTPKFPSSCTARHLKRSLSRSCVSCEQVLVSTSDLNDVLLE